METRKEKYSLHDDVDRYLAAGGVIHEIPRGVTGIDGNKRSLMVERTIKRNKRNALPAKKYIT